MRTLRECVWWGVAVAFALGVGLVSLAWMITLGMGNVIFAFVCLMVIAVAAGWKVFALLDEDIRSVET